MRAIGASFDVLRMMGVFRTENSVVPVSTVDFHRIDSIAIDGGVPRQPTTTEYRDFINLSLAAALTRAGRPGGVKSGHGLPVPLAPAVVCTISP
jgi:hypothetical protein